ncbi:MAG: hypothetical protein ABI306_05455 [Caulobacteraceae bacterium]
MGARFGQVSREVAGDRRSRIFARSIPRLGAAVAATVLAVSAIGRPSNVAARDAAGPTPAAEPPRYGEPFPFTPAQLWATLAKVIAMPDGYITPRQVENIFRLKLIRQRLRLGDHGDKVYGLTAPNDWYFDLEVDNPRTVGSGFTKQSGFTFSWSHYLRGEYIPNPSIPNNMCMGMGTVQDAIRQSGWKLYSPKEYPGFIPTDETFNKGRHSFIRVTYFSGCLQGLVMAREAVVVAP